jgi:hypothetical protein
MADVSAYPQALASRRPLLSATPKQQPQQGEQTTHGKYVMLNSDRVNLHAAQQLPGQPSDRHPAVDRTVPGLEKCPRCSSATAVIC